ncbi:Uncharacterised protein [Serratia quinivorans]|uniref:hypothetical protein n=1 Tax=Serratia quinivorans TaxID=137545 RepID=UPI00217B5552|nr:hypothetical protein [Serratia quinivorans]CAI0906797.1 Uncharacterised protein [Serratia quinivorans]CAI0924542.1 Uncharacterised protein [Serratia quinivorans]CAI1713764.1 Uncharacterised protein [Serratia quinivorans]CAI2089398.1 Uncharacterised protein [Serratia quinivorans]CAI2454697.1 Uncharacterised protein [Serratia quinivorans]
MEKFQRVHMPYGIREVKEGRWELFNRDYTALGEPFTFTRKLSTATVKALSADGSAPGEGGGLQTIWFYADGSVPTDKDEHWQAYSAKLKKLAGLKVE